MPEHVRAELIASITDQVADAVHAYVQQRVQVLAALDAEQLAALVQSAEARGSEH